MRDEWGSVHADGAVFKSIHPSARIELHAAAAAAGGGLRNHLEAGRGGRFGNFMQELLAGIHTDKTIFAAYQHERCVEICECDAGDAVAADGPETLGAVVGVALDGAIAADNNDGLG